MFALTISCLGGTRSGTCAIQAGVIMNTLFQIVCVAACLLLGVCRALGQGQPSTETPRAELVLGMTSALSGPTAQLGLDMKAGIEAALAEANAAGGVNGRRLRLTAMDDGYEPDRSSVNARTLVGNREVLALVGCVGTPTAVATIPVMLESKVLFYGAFSGAGVLRKNPPDRYVWNFRASYAQETGEMVDTLVKHAGLKPEEIGFFTQRDAYGDAGYAGGLAAMRRHGLENESGVAHGRYERNTDAVENALADLLSASVPVRAVIMVGAYQPCAKFVRLCREMEFAPLFLNVSFVGTEAFIEAAGEAGEGVIITQVVPPPESELPICREYLAAMAAWSPASATGFGSLEGYISQRILLRALAAVEGEVTREKLVDALEGLGEFEIGLGKSMSFGKADHQASDGVWPSVVRGKRAVSITWESLLASGKLGGVGE